MKDKPNGNQPKQYQCPHCGVVLETDEPIEGAQVACPECDGKFIAKQIKMRKENSAATIRSMCPHCFKFCDVAASAGGTYMACPSCGKRFRVKDNHPAGRKRLSMVPAFVFACISAVSGLFATAEGTDVGMVFFLLSFLLWGVFASILHYRCWKAIPASQASMTPGRAVFGTYSAVVDGIAGLGSDCARLARREGMQGFSHLETLGAIHAILVAGLFFICFFFVRRHFSPGLIVPYTLGLFVAWGLFYRGVTKLLNHLVETGRSSSIGGRRG